MASSAPASTTSGGSAQSDGTRNEKSVCWTFLVWGFTFILCLVPFWSPLCRLWPFIHSIIRALFSLHVAYFSAAIIFAICFHFRPNPNALDHMIEWLATLYQDLFRWVFEKPDKFGSILALISDARSGLSQYRQDIEKQEYGVLPRAFRKYSILFCEGFLLFCEYFFLFLRESHSLLGPFFLGFVACVYLYWSWLVLNPSIIELYDNPMPRTTLILTKTETETLINYQTETLIPPVETMYLTEVSTVRESDAIAEESKHGFNAFMQWKTATITAPGHTKTVATTTTATTTETLTQTHTHTYTHSLLDIGRRPTANISTKAEYFGLPDGTTGIRREIDGDENQWCVICQSWHCCELPY